MTVSAPIIRSIVPTTAKKFALANVTVADAAGNDVVYMSRDRRTIYAVGTGNSSPVLNTKLRYSTNDGVTWADVATFSEQCMGIVELDDGEALVATANSLWRSTGWTANKLTATWAKVFGTVGGAFRWPWGLSQFSTGANGVVVASVYGSQTVQTTGPAGSARYVYLSTDFGKTFNLIYDVFLQPGAGYQGGGLHIHASAYDEEWDRIWVTFGDNTGAGPSVAGGGTAQEIAYSDDRGVTWSYLPAPPEYGSMQMTAIGITRSAVSFQMDGTPYGMVSYPRLGYRKLGRLNVGPVVIGNTGTGNQIIGWSFSKAYGVENFPMFGAAIYTGSPGRHAGIWVSGTEGIDWQELWVDSVYSDSSGEFGIKNVVGPTINGRIAALYQYAGPSGSWKSAMLTADLIAIA